MVRQLNSSEIQIAAHQYRQLNLWHHFRWFALTVYGPRAAVVKTVVVSVERRDYYHDEMDSVVVMDAAGVELAPDLSLPFWQDRFSSYAQRNRKPDEDDVQEGVQAWIYALPMESGTWKLGDPPQPTCAPLMMDQDEPANPYVRPIISGKQDDGWSYLYDDYLRIPSDKRPKEPLGLTKEDRASYSAMRSKVLELHYQVRLGVWTLETFADQLGLSLTGLSSFLKDTELETYADLVGL